MSPAQGTASLFNQPKRPFAALEHFLFPQQAIGFYALAPCHPLTLNARPLIIGQAFTFSLISLTS